MDSSSVELNIHMHFYRVLYEEIVVHFLEVGLLPEKGIECFLLISRLEPYLYLKIQRFI
jgi:hypothetical protein